MSVRKIDFAYEEGVLACLTGDDTDLDDVMLDILMAEAERADTGEDDAALERWREDLPTSVVRAAYWFRGEAEVGLWRKQPCVCGMGHKWDLFPVEERKSRRGAFWAVLA